ncbi:hypothetical protein NMY22_g10727 [Coprinellus aureogranulatus]|nr:hypothetical protein NMY22_g10727 [Coprinellus aureogranulatus]
MSKCGCCTAHLPNEYRILEYEDRRIIVERKTSQLMKPQDATVLFAQEFGIPLNSTLRFYTTSLVAAFGKRVEIKESVWNAFIDRAHLLGAELAPTNPPAESIGLADEAPPSDE